VAVLTESGAKAKLVSTVRDFLGEDRARRLRPLDLPAYLNASREAIALASSALAEGRDRGYPATRECLAQVRDKEHQATRIEAQMAAAAPQEDMEGQLDVLQQRLADVARLEHDLSEGQRRYDDLARETVRLHTEIERRLRQLSHVEAASEDEVRVVKAAGRVSSVMEEFKHRLLARKIHELERLITERFCHLARKRDFISRVLVHPETFELSLFDVDGLPVLRDRLSAGEQQLLAVAFLWALALASGRNLPVVIDTPLGRMDHEHRRNLVERYFPHASHQVILLSTDAEIDERYREVLADAGAIDREYIVRFDPKSRQSEITPGYFWS
jgi:DNA sulfur modification protein DndD